MTFPAFGTPNFVTEIRGHYFSRRKVDIFGVFCQFWRSFWVPKVTKMVLQGCEISLDVILSQNLQKFPKKSNFFVFYFQIFF